MRQGAVSCWGAGSPANQTPMPVIYRTHTAPRCFDARLREAAEAVLSGDWRITALQSHLDGQWNVQFEGPQTRCRVVFSSLDTVTVSKLVALLTHLADPACSTFNPPPLHT